MDTKGTNAFFTRRGIQTGCRTTSSYYDIANPTMESHQGPSPVRYDGPCRTRPRCNNKNCPKGLLKMSTRYEARALLGENARKQASTALTGATVEIFRRLQS